MQTRWILREPSGKYYGNAYEVRRSAMYQIAHTSHAWRSMYRAGWRVTKVRLIEFGS